MALRNVINKNDDILRKKCRTVEKFDGRLHMLLDDMAETMYKAAGVGLAAPQVGILRRAVVIDVGEGLVELINPVITEAKGSQRDIEGCLSCPGEWGFVERPMNIIVEAFNRHGEEVTYKCSEYFARCVCHELDHLDGKLFIDIADEMADPDSIEEEQQK